MSYTLEFVGGIKDGELLAYGELPPEIRFPYMRECAFSNNYFSDDVPPESKIDIIRYKRLGDTCIYICFDWYK